MSFFGWSRLLYGAGVARRLDEGLDEHGRCVVALGPVLGQAAADEGEDVRAEIWDRDPGQDQEPRVVDHEGEVLFALLRGPSDEAVAGRQRARNSGTRSGRSSRRREGTPAGGFNSLAR